MSSIDRVSLQDTLYLIQLMRETALANGRQAQAERLTPLVQGIHQIVEKDRQAGAAGSSPTGVLAQSDFKKLLEVTQAKNTLQINPSTTSTVVERNRLVVAMAAADMAEVDIARQLGLTREEVRLVLSVQEKMQNSGRMVR